jgi:hypothetical protein
MTSKTPPNLPAVNVENGGNGGNGFALFGKLLFWSGLVLVLIGALVPFIPATSFLQTSEMLICLLNIRVCCMISGGLFTLCGVLFWCRSSILPTWRDITIAMIIIAIITARQARSAWSCLWLDIDKNPSPTMVLPDKIN